MNKCIKPIEKEQDINIIKSLSYVSKMNLIKKDCNSILKTLMKNFEMNFKEDEADIKYEEYIFNGIEPKNIQIKDIKPVSAKIYFDLDFINNIDKNKLKYFLKIRNETKGEEFKQINEIEQKEILIDNLDMNSNYEIGRDLRCL